VLYSISIIGVVLWGILFFAGNNKVHQSSFLGVFTCLLMIVFGSLTITFHDHYNHQKHYTSKIDSSSTVRCQVQIYKKLKPSFYHQKYLGKVIRLNGIIATGRILVNIDSTQLVTIDDVMYINTPFNEIKNAINPHQFDYGVYMKREQVYHQVYLNSKNVVKLVSEKSLYGISAGIRNRINETLVKHVISDRNLSVINALLLGQKQEVNKETYANFVKSGTIHILAISGLHIGLLMMLLGLIFKPLAYFKIGKKLTPFLIVILLWCYAFVTGMSASVLRAVTMFSLVTVAMYGNRITNTYNTLVISGFLLLLFNPFYLFDVGFQLSYLAVFSIISFKPLFDNLWSPESYLIKKIWDISSVTLAAQIGILPLSLFYFHQFPGLFFVSNLVIIPMLGVLLGLGIVTLVFAYFGWVPQYLLFLFDNCITMLNNFVEFVSSKEAFIFTNISFNTYNLVSIYVLIITILLLGTRYSYKRVLLVLFSVVFVQLAFVHNNINSQTNEFVVFNQYKAILIAHKKGRRLHYVTKNKKSLGVLDNYVMNEFIDLVVQDSLKNVFQFEKESILLVDKNTIYKTTFKPTIVLLSESPKINLERLIRTEQPKQVIFNNDNYKSYVKRWEATCLKNNIPFYNISKHGAFILEGGQKKSLFK